MPLQHRPVWPVKVSLPWTSGEAGVKLRRGSFFPHREVPMAETKVNGDRVGQVKLTKMAAVRRALRPYADHLIGVGRVPGCVRVSRFGPIVTSRDASSACSSVSAARTTTGSP